MILLGAALMALGVVIVLVATLDRRRRWREARPFAGDERAAPEPALVPNPVVYLAYLGWLLIAAGALTFTSRFVP